MNQMKFNWWDRLLIGIAPRWGLNRAKSKAMASVALRSYEAAGDGRRTTGWRHPSTDANAAGLPSLQRLRDLARDLRRNNPWAKRCVEVITSNTVGWGIMAKAQSPSAGVNASAQELWKQWSESVACDYDGRMPFAGLQALVMDTIVESGEALILKEAANASDGLPVPLRIRVLEPDYLDVNKHGSTEGGGHITQGIEVDSRGRRVAYWIYSQHPGATSGPFSVSNSGLSSKRVPASDVIHAYRVDRPGQLRGVAWLASVIAKLNDFDDYDDARLMQAKVAACFGALVTDPQGDTSPLGEEEDDDDTLENLEPGQIQYLKPGQEVTSLTPPSTSDHGGFSETQLRRIAAGLDVTYEDLTMDYSKVNFSSARMARLSHWQSIHGWRWKMLIPQFCDGVWGWFMELAAGIEGWGIVPSARWQPPPMPMLSPEKEGLAIQRLIRVGARTLPQVIREQGEDPDTHLQEYADSNATLDRLGIILDSDARKTTTAGMLQAEPATDPPLDASPSDDDGDDDDDDE